MNELADFAQEQHRDYRPYTKSGVFKTKLSPAQIAQLEKAGHGGIIRGINWTSMRSMADKGAVEIVEREIHHTSRGPVNGRIIAVRVK
jgi:hypothetical protein